jgi:hypothetical protein
LEFGDVSSWGKRLVDGCGDGDCCCAVTCAASHCGGTWGCWGGVSWGVSVACSGEGGCCIE